MEGPRLVDGMVLLQAVINLGTREVLTDTDGWTIAKDGEVSAHFEHDIVRKGKQTFSHLLLRQEKFRNKRNRS